MHRYGCLKDPPLPCRNLKPEHLHVFPASLCAICGWSVNGAPHKYLEHCGAVQLQRATCCTLIGFFHGSIATIALQPCSESVLQSAALCVFSKPPILSLRSLSCMMYTEFEPSFSQISSGTLLQEEMSCFDQPVWPRCEIPWTVGNHDVMECMEDTFSSSQIKADSSAIKPLFPGFGTMLA